jgi:serine/threonine protein kinase
VVGSGELVNGRYGLEYIVGAGGMGVVWAATNERLDRKVALKQIPLGADSPPSTSAGVTVVSGAKPTKAGFGCFNRLVLADRSRSEISG